jgi:hypothetical protein
MCWLRGLLGAMPGSRAATCRGSANVFNERKLPAKRIRDVAMRALLHFIFKLLPDYCLITASLLQITASLLQITALLLHITARLLQNYFRLLLDYFLITS